MDTLVERYSSFRNQPSYNHHSVATEAHRPSTSNCLEVCSEMMSSEKDMSRVRDYYEGVLKFIDEVLMEEDLQNQPCMFHQSSALQVAEKSFYDVIGEKYPYPAASDDSAGCNQSSSVSDQRESDSFIDQSSIIQIPDLQYVPVNSDHLMQFSASGSSREENFNNFMSNGATAFVDSWGAQGQVNNILSNDNVVNYHLGEKQEDLVRSSNGLKGDKIRNREDGDYLQEEQIHKQVASYIEEFEQSEMYDEVFNCSMPGLRGDHSMLCTKLKHPKQSKELKAGRPRVKKDTKRRELIDLRSLLTQCAQAVATNDVRTADETVKKIRQHSSPLGDGTERLAHYFANAIEARLAGKGIELYTDFVKRRISAVDMLKAYQTYVTACPFHKMSNILANKSISKLAEGVTRLHIIDFGILYGFQWPCLIQSLSARPGGPPKLRITGIDLPRPGFRPAERVEATGHHLANYCRKYNVEFEYQAIAKKWDTIELEDLKIDRDEMLVVNCLYRLRNVADETIDTSPRDVVLSLIKRINPDMFIHGVINGTYNAPFFMTRFREALFHFSSLFDMFETTELHEDKNRMLFEQEVFARDAMNVIACEGAARIERPETYKQWQLRNLKAGFRQLPLHQDLIKEVIAKVRLHYHKEFLVDEERNWMLQGWKGRVLYGLSLWKPVQE